MVRRIAFMASIGLIALYACKDADPHPPSAVEPDRDQPSSSGSVGSSGAASSGSPSDAAATDSGATTDAGRQCALDDTPIPLTGAVVSENAVSDEAPPGTGGLLQDGTYDLTNVQKYVGTGTPGPTGTSYRSTIKIKGGTNFERINVVGSTSEIHIKGVVQTTGVNLNLIESCPTTGGIEAYNYSQTATTLTLLNGSTMQTLTYTLKP